MFQHLGNKIDLVIVFHNKTDQQKLEKLIRAKQGLFSSLSICLQVVAECSISQWQ
jgi:hypothetical protein